MGVRKFYGAEDAARYAASITTQWQNEDGEIWDAETLIDVMNCADGENPLDEEFTPDEYYIVDENGAVGYTGDDCGQIYWYVTPAQPASRPAAASRPAQRFCPGCGAEISPEWVFCNRCGRKLR